MKEKTHKRCYLLLMLVMMAVGVWGVVLILDNFKQEEKYSTLEELRPCPFCGGTNIVYDKSEYSVMKEGVPDVERVSCKDCNLDMWAHPWHEDVGAKEKWNRRK